MLSGVQQAAAVQIYIQHSLVPTLFRALASFRGEHCINCVQYLYFYCCNTIDTPAVAIIALQLLFSLHDMVSVGAFLFFLWHPEDLIR